MHQRPLPHRLRTLSLVSHPALCPILFYHIDDAGPICFASPFPAVRHYGETFHDGEFVGTLENALLMHPDLSPSQRLKFAADVAAGLRIRPTARPRTKERGAAS